MAANATRRTGHDISVFSRRDKGVGAREKGDERGRKGTEDGRGTSGRGKFYKGKKHEK